MRDIAYKSGEALTAYEVERCTLDIYPPVRPRGAATVVWFHGGALKEGGKDDASVGQVARRLAAGGLGVVVPNYRLSPKARYPAYIQDAAVAVAWTRDRLQEIGGDPRRLFVGGHSAGAYLALMLAMDVRYLRDAGVEATAIAGVIAVSSQTMTHVTVREERGVAGVTADEAAPVYFVRKETAPLLVLYAEHDAEGRAAENVDFVARLKEAGNRRVREQRIADRGHASIFDRMAESGDAAGEEILRFVGERTGE